MKWSVTHGGTGDRVEIDAPESAIPEHMGEYFWWEGVRYINPLPAPEQHQAPMVGPSFPIIARRFDPKDVSSVKTRTKDGYVVLTSADDVRKVCRETGTSYDWGGIYK